MICSIVIVVEVSGCRGKDRGLHRAVFTMPQVDVAQLILTNREKLKQKQRGGQAEVEVRVWVDLTEQERANKQLIQNHTAYKEAKKRIVDEREKGNIAQFALGWGLDRAYTVEAGVRTEWHAD
jgi:hypothetical protein